MTCRSLIALALTAPALAAPQNLLDLVVQHAEGRGEPLLVPADIAIKLEALAPETIPDQVGRAALDDWLSQTGAALTSTQLSGWVVYCPGSPLANLLLEAYAPWVGAGDLEGRGQDLVWAVSPQTCGEESTDGLSEVRIGEQRVLGGPAGRILRATASRPDPITSPALVASTRPTEIRGTGVFTWLGAHADLTGTGQYSFSDATEQEMAGYLLWNVEEVEDLRRLGIGVRSHGPATSQLLELYSVQTDLHRRRGSAVFLEHLEDAAKSEPMEFSHAVLRLTYLSAREISEAMQATPGTPRALVGGKDPVLILSGSVRSVHRWWSWLREIDR